jgi:hypothetical protein
VFELEEAEAETTTVDIGTFTAGKPGSENHQINVYSTL